MDVIYLSYNDFNKNFEPVEIMQEYKIYNGYKANVRCVNVLVVSIHVLTYGLDI